MSEPVQELGMAEIVTVGKALTWPQYTLTIVENDQETSGGHFRITGATRDQAVRWLRSAADAINSGRKLRIQGFAGDGRDDQ